MNPFEKMPPAIALQTIEQLRRAIDRARNKAGWFAILADGLRPPSGG